MQNVAPPAPWLSIIGIGEDGLDGLSPAARRALDEADSVFGGARHLSLAQAAGRGRPWPSPFSITPLLERRGTKTAALASGDPFWFGAGTTIAAALRSDEWRAFPAPSCFALAVARLGWPLQDTICLGLHRAPFETLRRRAAPGARLLCLLADAAAPRRLADWLVVAGFGASRLFVLERLGGPAERVRETSAGAFVFDDVAAPVLVGLEIDGGAGLPRISGLADDLFSTDGQMTKAPIRALTLSALAPRPGELLWDIGAGSGSISIEWRLAGGTACAIEPRADRVAHIHENARRFGVADGLRVVQGHAPEALEGLPAPRAAFIGGGATRALIERVLATLPNQGRLVVNAVTLDTEALLLGMAGERGGALMRFEHASAEPLGRLLGWRAARPLTQWKFVKCA